MATPSHNQARVMAGRARVAVIQIEHMLRGGLWIASDADRLLDEIDGTSAALRSFMGVKPYENDEPAAQLD